MNWFSNMRVKMKLLVSFITIIAFVVILVALAYSTVTRLDNDYTYVLEYPEKRLQYLSTLDSNILDMRRAGVTFSFYADRADMVESFWTQCEAAYRSATEHIDLYVANNNADTVRDRATLTANNEKAMSVKKMLDEYYTQYLKQGVEIARQTADPAQTGAIVSAGATLSSQSQTAAEELVVSAKEIMDEISAQNTKNKNLSVLVFLLVSLVIVVFSIAIALFVADVISKPLRALTDFMKKAGATGDITLSSEDTAIIERLSRSQDEIGQCVSSTAGFIRHVTNVSDALGQVADGDLTAELALLSSNDVMGISLKKMTENLNSMFGEINASTAQVSTGSKQIADGAQSLAQGSTEQAAAVEQLSSSISEIAEKTRKNADMAGKAATLAGTIMSNAEKGSRQMDAMTTAVKEINEASQRINKVIKVIDDIAFQTNILALNAAVEAARAGQHGKGFAVVAEEVRNLAAKSAEAAKDTGGLIANSMEKAELGARIANETAESLVEIVSGINESSQIVGEIARSSEEQSQGISQINKGIDQVAQVVSQNSATAQESAAASEEMSGQANMLEVLIAQFKLKGGGGAQRHQSLPQASETSRRRTDAPVGARNDHGIGYGKY